jgi:hypothetical protein
MNVLDDSLSRDLAFTGSLTPAMVQRFVDTGALCNRVAVRAGVLFTCSAFGPAIEAAAQATGLPTLKPNEAMFEQALQTPAASGYYRWGWWPRSKPRCLR